MNKRVAILAIAALAVTGLALAGCSDDKKSSATTTTTAAPATTTTTALGGNVLPPIIITPNMAQEGGNTPIPAIKVGDTVVFSMGAIQQGVNVTAVSPNPSVFLVTSKGTNNGTVTVNAGGKAVAAGTVDVTVGATGAGVENFLGTYRLVITN